MSYTFTKLFSSLPESTIWVEPYATRIVWITMLATADPKGRVFGSIPGLAKRAAVTLEECEKALERFQQPDRYSRTPDNDGRRIEPIDGGWSLLNYSKYREMRDDEARREQNRIASATYREKLRASAGVSNPADNQPRSAQEEEEEEEEEPKPLRAAGAAPGGFERFWKAWPSSPRKVGKAACLKKWNTHRLDDVVETIVSHVETMKRSDQWKSGFEPAPLTYLNQRRWEDGAPGEDPPGEKPWFLTEAGIRKKGSELSFGNWDEIEPFPAYRDRVFLKAGVTKAMYEKAKKDWTPATKP